MNKPGKQTPSESGFSLVEVTIALAVLSAATLSSLLVLVPVSRQGRISREMEVAALEARRVVDKLHAVPFTAIPTMYPVGYRISVSKLTSGQITVNHAEPTPDPLEVDVTLTWNGELGEGFSRTFRTMRTK